MTHIHVAHVTICTFVTAILVGFGSATQAGEGGIYVGAELGLGKSAILCDSGPHVYGCNDTALTGGGFIGYRSDGVIGAEIGFRKMGPVSIGSTAMLGNVRGSTSNEFELRYSAGLSVIAYVPFFDEFAPFARIGLHTWAVSREETTTIGLASGTTRQHESGTNLLVGAGAQYRVGERVYIRAEWERLRLDYEQWRDDEIDIFLVGVLYRF